MTDRDFHETSHDGIRTVIYRAQHPETGQDGWAGFVESDVCTQLGWWRSRMAAAWRARQVRKDHR